MNKETVLLRWRANETPSDQDKFTAAASHSEAQVLILVPRAHDPSGLWQGSREGWWALGTRMVASSKSERSVT